MHRIRQSLARVLVSSLTMLDCDFDQIGEVEAPMMKAYKVAGKRLIAERRKMLARNFN